MVTVKVLVMANGDGENDDLFVSLTTPGEIHKSNHACGQDATSLAFSSCASSLLEMSPASHRFLISRMIALCALCSCLVTSATDVFFLLSILTRNVVRTLPVNARSTYNRLPSHCGCCCLAALLALIIFNEPPLQVGAGGVEHVRWKMLLADRLGVVIISSAKIAGTSSFSDLRTAILSTFGGASWNILGIPMAAGAAGTVSGEGAFFWRCLGTGRAHFRFLRWEDDGVHQLVVHLASRRVK